MDEYFTSTVNETTEDVKEETMEEKTILAKAFDFVKTHKLEIAAGIGLAYLGYKFGAKCSYNVGYNKGIAEGIEQEFLRSDKFMVDVIAPQADMSYEVIRTVTKDGYNQFISKPLIMFTQDELNSIADIIVDKKVK